MAVIASQNFNAIPSDSTFTADENIPDGTPLTNAGSSHTSTGAGDLGFETQFFNTGAGQGPAATDSSDFIGVNSFTGTNAPDVAADGTPVAAGSEHNFQFNDGDGRLALVFDSVDVSAFESRTVSLNYFIADTGFESNDSFTITISDGVTTVEVLAFGETELEANGSADDGTANWNTLNIDLDTLIADNGLDATNITLTVNVETNSGSENIFIDNVAFEGEATGPATNIVINEVDADQTGTDAAEFIELFDGGAGNTSLDGLVLVLFNGSDDQSYDAIDLDGFTTDENGFFVIGSANVPNVDLIAFTTNGIQNGADAVALFVGSAADFPNDTAISTDGLLDVVVYGSNDADDPGLLSGFGETTQFNDTNEESVARDPDGTGTFSSLAPTPGENNVEPPEPATDLSFNEIRISSGGASDNTSNFIELFGTPNTSLDGLTLVVVSGEFSPGSIDFAFDLTGSSTDEDGIFLLGNPGSGASFDTGDLQTSFDLFGSPTTFLLVQNFTGTVGDDLDTNDDGLFDITPFGAVVDSVSLTDGDATPDVNFSDNVVGPDGNFSPAHVFSATDGSGVFTIGSFGDLADDTPGELNAGAPPATVIASALTGSPDVNLTDFVPGEPADFPLGDAFRVLQRGVDTDIPFALADDSAGVFTPDELGIVQTDDTLPFFGVSDTVNAVNSGPLSAEWTFDISGAANPYLSIDIAGIGDFEASTDSYTFEVSIDGGEFTTAIDVFINEDGAFEYTLDSGTVVVLDDPAVIADTNTALTNIFETFFTSLPSGGSTLTVRFTADTNGGDEAFAFRNIIVTDGEPNEGVEIGNDPVGNGGGNNPVTPPEPDVSEDFTTLVGDDDHLTTLTFNIRGVDNFATGELADNAVAVADQIVNFSGSPDIIALQEVSNPQGQAQLEAIVEQITLAGGPAYEIVFIESTIQGTVGSTSITNAFLYRPDRVDFVEGSAELLADVQVGNSFPRFPLIGEFTFNGETITLINAHLSSGAAGSDPDFNEDAAERLEQAGELQVILDALLDADPDANVIVLGDYNDTQFGEPTIELVNDELTNLFTEGDPSELTTSTFGQPIDHIAVSDSLAASAELDYVRVNADFGLVVSDHDPVIGRFLFRQQAVQQITALDFSLSLGAAVASATAISLVNSGHIADYFDARFIRGAQIQVLQDGVDDFLIIAEVRGRFVAFDFDDVGSLGNNADENLYEFLSALESSGLPAGSAFTVGRAPDLAADAPFDLANFEFAELLISNNDQVIDASNGIRDLSDFGDRIAFFTGGSQDIATLAGDDDVIIGDNNRDSFVEELIGGDGDDLLIGGRGTDLLNGGDGSDDYLYRLGDGDDTIIESGEGFDTLSFGEGINVSDVTIIQADDDPDSILILIDDGSTDGSVIRVTSADDDFGGVDQIVFADGTVLNDDDGFGFLGGLL